MLVVFARAAERGVESAQGVLILTNNESVETQNSKCPVVTKRALAMLNGHILHADVVIKFSDEVGVSAGFL